MSTTLVRVECNLENASTSIDGIAFAPLPGAPVEHSATGVRRTMVSEPIERTKADRLCSIAGFTLCSRSDEELAAVDRELEAQRLRPTDDGNGQMQSQLAQTIEEAHEANRRMSAELGAANQRIRDLEDELAKRPQDTPGAITALERQRDEARAEVARLTGELTTARAENDALRQVNKQLDEGGLVEENAQLKAKVADLENDLNELLEDDGGGEGAEGEGGPAADAGAAAPRGRRGKGKANKDKDKPETPAQS